MVDRIAAALSVPGVDDAGGVVRAALRAGRLDPHATALLGMLHPAAVRHAAEQEMTYVHGRVCGLRDDEIREVIAAWNVWYQGVAAAFSWSQVRSSLAARGIGVEWRPGRPLVAKRREMVDVGRGVMVDARNRELLATLGIKARW